MIYFIQDERGERHAIPNDLAQEAIHYKVVDILVKTKAMTVIRRKSAKPMFEERLNYGGGRRLRNPFDT